MKELTHFRPLERCACGALQYLAVREHKKSFEIVLIHQAASSGREYAKVASFKKSELDFHRLRNLESREGDTLLESALQMREGLEGLITELQKRNKDSGESLSSVETPLNEAEGDGVSAREIGPSNLGHLPDLEFL